MKHKRNDLMCDPWDSQGNEKCNFYFYCELVEVFLKLSMKTVQVYLIIWTTLKHRHSTELGADHYFLDGQIFHVAIISKFVTSGYFRFVL